MIKIAFVLERLSNGGAERVTAALANSLATKDNIEVHIFTYVEEKEEYALADSVIRHNMNSGNVSGISGLLEKIKYLYTKIRIISPDYVISLATPKTSILLSFLSIGAKYKLILSERNDPNRYPKEELFKVLRNMSYSACDGVVFQTPDAQAYFSERIQRKSIVIPNPISEGLPERFTGTRRKSIVDFCRLEPQKNLKFLIRAFAKVVSEYDSYTLDIYGDGPQKRELEELTKELGIESHVVFHGFTREIHQKIYDAALYVSSSDYEGISNSMLEALAIGIPTISTDCPIGGARMMINNNVNGILVPVDCEDELVDAIKRVLSTPQLMNDLSCNGYKLRFMLSAETISEKWLHFLVSR